MNEPEWIEDSSAVDIHDLQLKEHGGLVGVRDQDLLSSALCRSRNLWHYSRDSVDLAALAACYAAGIARNHPFFDGNKRTAAVVCEAFLRINGYALGASDIEWYDAMIGLASGALSEEQLAHWIRARLAPQAD